MLANVELLATDAICWYTLGRPADRCKRRYGPSEFSWSFNYQGQHHYDGDYRHDYRYCDYAAVPLLRVYRRSSSHGSSNPASAEVNKLIELEIRFIGPRGR